MHKSLADSPRTLPLLVKRTNGSLSMAVGDSKPPKELKPGNPWGAHTQKHTK